MCVLFLSLRMIFAPTPFREALGRLAGFEDRLAKALSRWTSGHSFIPEMDGLRFFPILGVVFHHAIAAWLTLASPYRPVDLPMGWQAKVKGISLWFALASQANFSVHLFFVISGFVLAIPFLRPVIGGASKPRLGHYYLRRITRLEPPYLLALTITFALIVLRDGKPFGMYFQHFLASAVYLHGLAYGSGSWVMGVAWSLEVEAQFYLLMPLLARLFFLRNAGARRMWIGGSLFVWSLLSQDIFDAGRAGAFARVGLPNFLQFFLAGFLLADFYVGGWRRNPPTRKFAWDLAGLAAGIALLALLVNRPRLPVRGLSYSWNGGCLAFVLPWLIIVLYAAAFRGVFFNWAVTQKWVVVCGGMCYTAYLYHQLVIQLTFDHVQAIVQGRFGPHPESFLVFILLLVPIFLLTAVLFVLVEKPFMKWRPWVRVS